MGQCCPCWGPGLGVQGWEPGAGVRGWGLGSGGLGGSYFALFFSLCPTLFGENSKCVFSKTFSKMNTQKNHLNSTKDFGHEKKESLREEKKNAKFCRSGAWVVVV